MVDIGRYRWQPSSRIRGHRGGVERQPPTHRDHWAFRSAAEFAATQPTTGPGPVVLFDLPCEGGGQELEALRQICDTGHRVIVYTCLVDDDVVSAALDAGAVSCIARAEPEHVLAAAIYA